MGKLFKRLVSQRYLVSREKLLRVFSLLSKWRLSRTGDFVAIKILKGDSTSLHESGFFRELDVLKAVSHGKDPATTHCIQLIDSFQYEGKEKSK